MDVRWNKPVLVLEDQILIALYVEELLQQAGFKNIATYSSREAADEWLSRNTPQIVVKEKPKRLSTRSVTLGLSLFAAGVAAGLVIMALVDRTHG